MYCTPLSSGGGKCPARMFTCTEGRIRRGMPRVAYCTPLSSGGGKCPAQHVHLYRRQNQAWHAKGGVALFAHGDELRLADALVHMDVVTALLADGGLPAKPVAPFRQVVVAEKHAGLVGQR